MFVLKKHTNMYVHTEEHTNITNELDIVCFLVTGSLH